MGCQNPSWSHENTHAFMYSPFASMQRQLTAPLPRWPFCSCYVEHPGSVMGDVCPPVLFGRSGWRPSGCRTPCDAAGCGGDSGGTSSAHHHGAGHPSLGRWAHHVCGHHSASISDTMCCLPYTPSCMFFAADLLECWLQKLAVSLAFDFQLGRSPRLCRD